MVDKKGKENDQVDEEKHPLMQNDEELGKGLDDLDFDEDDLDEEPMDELYKISGNTIDYDLYIEIETGQKTMDDLTDEQVEGYDNIRAWERTEAGEAYFAQKGLLTPAETTEEPKTRKKELPKIPKDKPPKRPKPRRLVEPTLGVVIDSSKHEYEMRKDALYVQADIPGFGDNVWYKVGGIFGNKVLTEDGRRVKVSRIITNADLNSLINNYKTRIKEYLAEKKGEDLEEV